jgi:periplasmic mercuric ion binding protein
MTRIFVAAGSAAMILAAASAAERTITLAVDNMYCEACPYIVKESLVRVPGVETVVVSYERKSATVTYDDQKTTIDALTSATTQAGYPSRATP